ncbi:MAG: dihydroorotate dehydrogenase electron transfer subunit [archaeon]
MGEGCCGGSRPPKEPFPTTLLRTKDEADGIKTFSFSGHLCGAPGQFIMLWLPGVNERPFSIYQDNHDSFSITVSKVGGFTEALFSAKKGASFCFTGPHGNPFSLSGKRIALVGGGYGAAPLTWLAKAAAVQGIKSDLIIGARSKNLILYRSERYPGEVTRHYCTDDGSFGEKGMITDVLRRLLEKGGIDMVYTVGPELMMKAVVDLTDKFKVGCQISLERYMKCGCGICGSCSVDPLGIRMCVEGPCIDKSLAKKITEFGVYHRDASGKKTFF